MGFDEIQFGSQAATLARASGSVSQTDPICVLAALATSTRQKCNWFRISLVSLVSLAHVCGLRSSLAVTQRNTIDRANCTNCGQPVLPHQRHCVRCQADCGFPNVRAAEQPVEKNALTTRVKSAQDNAESRGTEGEEEQGRGKRGRRRSPPARVLEDVLQDIERQKVEIRQALSEGDRARAREFVRLRLALL